MVTTLPLILEAGSDFESEMVDINEGTNCTMIHATDDNIYERNEVFIMMLTDQENMVNRNNSVRYTLIVRDNDGKYLFLWLYLGYVISNYSSKYRVLADIYTDTRYF